MMGPNYTVHVNNVPNDATKDRLFEYFNEVAPVVAITIYKQQGQNKSYARIRYATDDCILFVCEKLDGSFFEHQLITVVPLKTSKHYEQWYKMCQDPDESESEDEDDDEDDDEDE